MKFKLSGSSATIVASLIGGAFALAASVLPSMLAPTEPTAPAGGNSQANAAPSAAAPSTGAAPLAATPGAAASTSVAAPMPNFQLGTWTVTASNDDHGNSWNHSTIKFQSERATADGVEFDGFFEWRMNDRLLGREFFAGRYVAADRTMYFEGRSVQSPTNELAVGSYSCRLSDDGRRLLDGTWGSTAGNLSGVLGVWTARR